METFCCALLWYILGVFTSLMLFAWLDERDDRYAGITWSAELGTSISMDLVPHRDRRRPHVPVPQPKPPYWRPGCVIPWWARGGVRHARYWWYKSCMRRAIKRMHRHQAYTGRLLEPISLQNIWKGEE